MDKFTELMDKTNECIKKHENLKAELQETKKKAHEIIKSNLSLIRDDFQVLSTKLFGLAQETGTNPDFYEAHKTANGSICVHMNAFRVKFYLKSSIHETGFYTMEDFLDTVSDYSNLPSFYAVCLMLLGTPEKALTFMEFFRNTVCTEVLQQVIDKLDEDNIELVNSITQIKAYITENPVVKHKDDGTVEVVLNGKTYIGTVKEQ